MSSQYSAFSRSTSDSEKPLIAVVGASSKQGRSVTQALLQSGRYRVRALTRNTTSLAAQALARQGAELVQVPLQLGIKRDWEAAFRGAHGAFLMTPAILPPATYEVDLGKEQADATLAAGVQHVVFSGLENVEERTAGKKWAPHFTDKARIETYIRELPVVSSFVYLSFFYTNIIEYYPPRQVQDSLIFSLYLPVDVAMPFVDPLTATGPAVLEMFDKPQAYRGKSMPVIGEILSAGAMVETFRRVTGRHATYEPAYTREDLLRHFPAFGANELLVRELLGMAEYAVEYGYFAKDRDLQWSRSIDPQALTWEQFLRQTNWQGNQLTFGAASA